MKIEDTCARMTLEDKVALGSGKDFWHTKKMRQYGIESIMVADGPHGLRKQPEEADILGINEAVKATSFPTAVLSACSWDEELLQQMGKVIAAEAKANGVSVILGPGANIKRNPLCGRNFEYFSEDPYLTGKMAAAFIKGAQSTGAGTSLKHFAMNSQEYKRFSSDSIVDERTMREIYLTGFEMAVKQGKPDTVMCCYNKVNGEYGSDNKKLLTDILREEWGFDGLVVTDWGAMNDRIKGYKAGCDLAMPGGSSYMEKETVEAVKKGLLAEEDVDRSVKRVLRLVEKGQAAVAEPTQADMEKHFEFARRVAEESAVLLKNEDRILPILNKDEVAFIGYMAQEIRYQGSGSSHINPWKLVSVTEACPDVAYAKGCNPDGSTNKELLEQACELAGKKEKVVLFAGLTDSYEAEGFDRENMKMPAGHLEMIETVSKVNPNIIVVLMCGSAVEVPWIDQVKGVLYMGLPGEAGGEAIAHVLFGYTNPSGKLAETWPLIYEDCISSSFYSRPYKDAQYREGVYVGYRYYESAKVPVRFPFGYGLSYTEFTYSNLKVEGEQVSCLVTNTGKVTGKEIVQLYVETKESNVYRPVRELKAFVKVELNPRESKRVSMKLDRRSFAIWDNGWKIPEGSYYICIGRDCQRIELRKEITICKEADVKRRNSLKVTEGGNSEKNATEAKNASKSEGTFKVDTKGKKILGADDILKKDVPAWYNDLKGIPSQEDFEQLIGRKIIEKPLKKGEFTMQNTVQEMREYSLIMKLLYKVMERMMAKSAGGKIDYSNATYKMMINTATDCSMTGMKINGGMDNYLLEGLLEMANGHFFKGLGMMLKK